MAKKILLKSKDGVEVSFALTQIILKGETTIKFPDAEEWSDGASKTYVYGDSYIAKIPDELFTRVATALMPAPVVENPTDSDAETENASAESETGE